MQISLRSILTAAAAVTLIPIAANSVQADSPAPLPTFSVGDAYEYSGDSSYSLTVSAVEGDVVTFEMASAAGAKATWTSPTSYVHLAWEYRGTTDSGADMYIKRSQVSGDEMTDFWPLEVGPKNKVTYKHSDPADWGRSDWTCQVKGAETVTVKAGAFDTYKINCWDSDTIYTSYHAPELGYRVKFVYTNRHTRETSTSELISYKKAGGS